MDIKKQLTQTLNRVADMAIATSVGNQPNVRVVTFGYDENNKEGKLFFTTFRGSPKTGELARNPKVACYIYAENEDEPITIRIFGEAQKASVSLDYVLSLIAPKSPKSIELLKN